MRDTQTIVMCLSRCKPRSKYDREWIEAAREAIMEQSDAISAMGKQISECRAERNVLAHALWSAEDQWGDEPIWQKRELSHSLTNDLKKELMKAQRDALIKEAIELGRKIREKSP